MWRRLEQVRLRQRPKRKRHQLPNAAEDDPANNHRSQLNPQLPGGQEEGQEAVKIKDSGSQPKLSHLENEDLEVDHENGLRRPFIRKNSRLLILRIKGRSQQKTRPLRPHLLPYHHRRATKTTSLMTFDTASGVILHLNCLHVHCKKCKCASSQIAPKIEGSSGALDKIRHTLTTFLISKVILKSVIITILYCGHLSAIYTAILRAKNIIFSFIFIFWILKVNKKSKLN